MKTGRFLDRVIWKLKGWRYLWTTVYNDVLLSVRLVMAARITHENSLSMLWKISPHNPSVSHLVLNRELCCGHPQKAAVYDVSIDLSVHPSVTYIVVFVPNEHFPPGILPRSRSPRIFFTGSVLFIYLRTLEHTQDTITRIIRL